MLVMADHVCECCHCKCKVKFDCNESGCLCCSFRFIIWTGPKIEGLSQNYPPINKNTTTQTY